METSTTVVRVKSTSNPPLIKAKEKNQLVVGYLPECNAHKVDSYNRHFEVRIQSFLPRCPTPLRGSLDLEGCKFVERGSDLLIIRHKLIVKTVVEVLRGCFREDQEFSRD